MSFLPDNYKTPAGNNNYMKLAQGENVFRILSDAIVGWEWWTSETSADGKEIRKPNRVPKESSLPIDAANGEQMPKHFWAMIVWNYDAAKVQILEITQRSIQKSIIALSKSKGWGDPKGYDLSVTRSGEKLETEYTVMPIPPEKLPQGIVDAYKATSIDITALYRGEDPFEVKSEVNPDDVKL